MAPGQMRLIISFLVTSSLADRTKTSMISNARADQHLATPLTSSSRRPRWTCHLPGLSSDASGLLDSGFSSDLREYWPPGWVPGQFRAGHLSNRSGGGNARLFRYQNARAARELLRLPATARRSMSRQMRSMSRSICRPSRRTASGDANSGQSRTDPDQSPGARSAWTNRVVMPPRAGCCSGSLTKAPAEMGLIHEAARQRDLA